MPTPASIRLPEPLREMIRERARVERRSFSNQCWLLLEAGGKPLLGLLREQKLAVGEHVELTVRPRDDFGVVLGSLRYLGRETRGPPVVAASDGAVVDLDAHAGSYLRSSTASKTPRRRRFAHLRPWFRQILSLEVPANRVVGVLINASASRP